MGPRYPNSFEIGFGFNYLSSFEFEARNEYLIGVQFWYGEGKTRLFPASLPCLSRSTEVLITILY